MARRGISRDHILATLRKLGADFPPASARLLRWAYAKGFDIRVLSDCNSVFISHVFHGERPRLWAGDPGWKAVHKNEL